jgi:hypothetical protein
MSRRRITHAAAAVGVAAVAAAATPGFGAAASPVHFAPKVFVSKTLAGGEPSIFYDGRHQDYIYSSHEGTTHTLHDGVIEAPVGTADWATNYRNQVNIWTSRNGKTWTATNFSSTGFPTDPTKNSGFSDPDLTQDDSGRIYDTGINLANDALFSSGDGGRTWDKGTINCHEGDRPWLAAAHPNEVFLATDPTYSEGGHTIFRSTDGGNTCSSFGIGDYGSGYSGFGKLYYNRANGSLVEPVIYGSSGIGVGILPHASRAFNTQSGSFHVKRLSGTRGLLTHFPAMYLDRLGNIYLSWTDAPLGGTGGKNSVWLVVTDKNGKVLVKPHVIFHNGHTALWPWTVVGAPGNVSVVWYQYDREVDNPDNANTQGNVYIYNETILGLFTKHPKTYITNASGKPVHTGGICQGGTTCVATGQDRRLGDYFTNYVDAHGCVLIASGDTTVNDPVTGKPMAWSLPIFIHQNGGPSLTHGSCGRTKSGSASASSSGIGAIGGDGGRGLVAGIGMALLLGAAYSRVRRTAPALAG